MTEQEWKAWITAVEESESDWQMDMIPLINRGELFLYKGGVNGVYISCTSRGRIEVGTYEGALPHIGEAMFTPRITNETARPAHVAEKEELPELSRLHEFRLWVGCAEIVRLRGQGPFTDEGNAWFERYDLDAELRRRFPLLLRSMKWVACLNETEALAAIRARYLWRKSSMAAGEAVTHFCSGGSVDHLFERAYACRTVVRDMYRDYAKRLGKEGLSQGG